MQRGKAAGRGLKVLRMGFDRLFQEVASDRHVAPLHRRKAERIEQFRPLALRHLHHGQVVFALRATGQDEALPADEVHAMFEGMLPMDEVLRGSGVFGPKIEPADGDV